jgi:hypothetical protein
MNIQSMLNAIANADKQRLRAFHNWAMTQDQEKIAVLLWAAAYRNEELKCQ